MDGNNSDTAVVSACDSYTQEQVLSMNRAVFKLLWSKDERMRSMLEAHCPRRLEQERIFRTRGKSCRYYIALCKTIVADIIEGKLSPEFVEIVNEEIQHAGSAV